MNLITSEADQSNDDIKRKERRVGMDYKVSWCDKTPSSRFYIYNPTIICLFLLISMTDQGEGSVTLETCSAVRVAVSGVLIRGLWVEEPGAVSDTASIIKNLNKNNWSMSFINLVTVSLQGCNHYKN